MAVGCVTLTCTVASRPDSVTTAFSYEVLTCQCSNADAKIHQNPGLSRHPICNRLSTTTMLRNTYPNVGDHSHSTGTCRNASLTSFSLRTMRAPTPYFAGNTKYDIPLAAHAAQGGAVEKSVSALTPGLDSELAKVRQCITWVVDVDPTTANGDSLSLIISLSNQRGKTKERPNRTSS